MLEFIQTATLALIPGFLLLDFVIQRRRYAKTRFWRLRGFLVTVAIFFFTGEVAVLWGKLLGDYHLFDTSGLGIFAGAALGVVIYEIAHYWYHRAAHDWDWLWHAGHQMHHSAESLDTFGAYYLHPIDAALFTTWSSLVFFPVLGLSVESAIVAAFFLTFFSMFTHANIATPHWLGYLIQRPESHHIHHERGLHRYNYADLPVLDMIFGTFRNPTSLKNERVGFYDGASSRIVDMLVGRDVSEPRPVPVAEVSQLKTSTS